MSSHTRANTLAPVFRDSVLSEMLSLCKQTVEKRTVGGSVVNILLFVEHTVTEETAENKSSKIRG